MLVRGKPLAEIQDRIEAYAEQSGRLAAPRLFLISKHGHGFRLGALEGQHFAQFMAASALWFAGQAALVKLPLRADRLRVKNNIRAFYAAESCTAKIALPSPHRSGSLLEEMCARRDLAGSIGAPLALPRLLRHDDRTGQWFEEELVDSSPARALDKARRFIRVAAEQLYRATLRRVEIAEALGMMGAAEEDLQRLTDLPQAQRTFVGRVAAARIHGDLSPDNMLADGSGNLNLIDWELSTQAPVAHDLKKLFTYDPDGTLAVLESLRQPPDASAKAQMRLALCCQLAVLRRDREKRLGYLTSNRNKSTAKAQRMVAQQDAELRSAIERLWTDEQ